MSERTHELPTPCHDAVLHWQKPCSNSVRRMIGADA